LALRINSDIDKDQFTDLIFICTHNSRRSHMGHLWAQLAASCFGIEGVRCFSGGTEATAFNPRAIQALLNSGMIITQREGGSNPLYGVRLPGMAAEVQVFSKRYSDPPNPVKDFHAVMTCSDADEACPIVAGALSRHAIMYEDPKKYDDTPEESIQYEERSRQIAREMLYLFSSV
jgi:protein-tyrosine-phosphatase